MPATTAGTGWQLQVYEYLVGIYKLGHMEAMRYPLARVWALSAAYRVRSGLKPASPSYADLDLIDAIDRAAERWDRAHPA